MRKLTLFFALNLCFAMTSFADVSFLNGSDIKTAKQRAAREGKLIFLEFYANYCTPCQMMEEYTFSNPSVSSFIKENYIPVKVDIQTFDGYDLKNQFKVSLLPTIIVLNSKGVQIGKHEETFDAKRFVSVMNNYNNSKNKIRIQTNSGEGYSQVTGYSNISTGQIHTGNRENAALAYNNTEKKNSEVRASRNIPIENAQPTKASANTFTIQVGAFTSESQLKPTVDAIKAKYKSGQKVYVSRKKENGKTMYRVLLGQFSTKQQALTFTQTNKIKGFVRSLDKI